jgi:hypothetical protein
MDVSKRIGRPSWSWSTVPYKVYIRAIEAPEAMVVDCEVKPTFPDFPFGQINRAVLTIKARVLKPSDVPGFLEQYRTQGKVAPSILSSDLEITLDFPDSKIMVETKNIRIVFLGWGSLAGIFLIVYQRGDGRYERVGLAKWIGLKGRHLNIWMLAKPQVIVIE